MWVRVPPLLFVIEEYLTWEDEIRLTSIELLNYMYEHSNPIEHLIEFAWANGADRFIVNNAKDELKRLRQEIESYRTSFEKPTAWARTNDRNDLFDLRLQNNPYVDQNTVVPLYRKPKND